MRSPRQLSSARALVAAIAVCLLIAACGGSGKGAGKHGNAHPPQTSSTALSAPPTSFKAGYVHAFGVLRQVDVEIVDAITAAQRLVAKHQTVSNESVAVKFARFASVIEPAVIELQGLTPPAKVARAFRSMSAAAVAMSSALRNFSTDANLSHTAQGRQDLAAYFTYANRLVVAADEIYRKLGIK